MSTSSERTLLTGWGRTAPTAATVVRPRSAAEVAELLRDAPPRGVVPRGLGRSYGDAAQSAGGLVLDCTGLESEPRLDAPSGTVTVSAGTSLGRLLRELVPLGWCVPVLPGTRHVTAGGAVAADVHGKNHHVDGSFGQAVTALRLVRPDGSCRRVSPDDDPDLFWATVGGMGLTGVITEVTFRCRRIETSRMRVDTRRTTSLDETLDLLSETTHAYGYTVAWVDLLSRGRGVVTRADHATVDDLSDGRDPLAYSPRTRVAVPSWVPSGLLNRVTVRGFNELWFRKAPADRRGEITSMPAYFSPLDSLAHWNRLYGRRGLLQYQFVVPDGAEEVVREAASAFASDGLAPNLAVLKRLGPGSAGMLSFPLAGWTLAVDLPAADARLGRVLRALNAQVAAAGGRVYLAKDAVLTPDLVPQMYPRLAQWRAVRDRIDPDRVLRSDLARRLDL